MSAQVPLLDLGAHHVPLRPELDAALARVLDHGHFINGPEVTALEAAVASRLGVRHAIGVSSGTDALLISLMAFGVGPGDEVITPDYSFFATAGAVARLGARPVFVDVNPSTFNIDPKAFERAVTRRTRAVIPVHLFGQSCDMDPILTTARRRGLRVIEDAAQALGAEYRGGRRVGTMGDVGCFSFFPTKNLGAMGDAGMVVTDDTRLAERIRILRSHGSKPKYFHRFIGGNFRLDTLQAAVLLVKLPHLDRWTKLRQVHAARYGALFRENALLDRGVRPPPPPPWAADGADTHIYNQYVIRVPARDSVLRALQRRGIGCEVYYPRPFHRQQCFRDIPSASRKFPVSAEAARSSLAIPIAPELTEGQQDAVVAALVEATRRRRRA